MLNSHSMICCRFVEPPVPPVKPRKAWAPTIDATLTASYVTRAAAGLVAVCARYTLSVVVDAA